MIPRTMEPPAPSVPLWKRIRPEEYVFAIFALALAVLVQFGTGDRYGWRALGEQLIVRIDTYGRFHLGSFSSVMALTVGAILVLWAALRSARSKILAIVRDAAPFIFSYLAYVLLRDLVPFIRPTKVDLLLADMETALFGTPTYVAIPRAIGCAFLDYVLMGCYWSHFYVPPGFALFLAYRDRAAFRRYMLAVSFACGLGYLGYVAVPAIGPKYVFANYELWRVAPGVEPFMSTLDSVANVTRDCFPSLHVAWTVMTLWAAWPYRRFFWVYLPVGAGLILATLYFGFHYFIDLPAGALLAVLSILISRWVRERWTQPAEDGKVAAEPEGSRGGSSA